jgi:UDP-3-O-[3-hydroxymyristoyl] N-acetylglucosamine deacetylase
VAESQRTVRDAIAIEGVGLHSGLPARVVIQPAPGDHGLLFICRDRGGAMIPATHPHLTGSSFATSLARGEARVLTVEHLLSALHGLGVDNARLEIDGPEVPILDGSARPFVEAILSAGLRAQARPRRYLGLRRPIAFARGDKEILALPANEFQFTYAIEFPHDAIGYQAVTASHTPETYAASIAPARTFCLLRDVEAMKRAGLALGGSLENAVVVGEEGVINRPLRFPDEFVRHKVLDLIGDLALLGSRLRAHVIAFKGGHQLHAGLIGRILASRTAWTLATSEERLPASQLDRFLHLRDRLVPRRVALTA